MKKKFSKIYTTALHILSVVISFWIPLIGFLTWFIYKKSNPRNSKHYLIAASIGFVVNYILTSF